MDAVIASPGLTTARAPAKEQVRPAQNFALVQSLRGIAAMWVVLFHTSEGGHIEGLKAVLPRAANVVVFNSGHYGVAIFFALSGFVIAHSLRGRAMTWGFVGRFALRRSIRLDPSYWASMVLAVGIAWAAARVDHRVFMPPSGPQVAAHLFYLQELLGFPEINTVYWTLTYEVQFYLFFAATLVIATKIARRSDPERTALIAWAPLFLLGLLSASGVFDSLHGLFAVMWKDFFVGALAYAAALNPRARPFFLIFLAAQAARLLILGDLFSGISSATAILLFWAARTGYAEDGLNWRWLQGLGAISYSLYLIHNPVTAAFGRVLKLVDPNPGALVSTAFLIAIVAVAVITAAMFWWVFERPSHRLSRRVSLPRGGAEADAINARGK